jgi:hypothetical protein
MPLRFLLFASLLAAGAAQAQSSPIRTLADLLRLREGQLVHVREARRDPLAGTLVRVVEDHFCIQFKQGDEPRARCYPYTAIRAVSPSAPDDPYYIVELL